MTIGAPLTFGNEQGLCPPATRTNLHDKDAIPRTYELLSVSFHAVFAELSTSSLGQRLLVDRTFLTDLRGMFIAPTGVVWKSRCDAELSVGREEIAYESEGRNDAKRKNDLAYREFGRRGQNDVGKRLWCLANRQGSEGGRHDHRSRHLHGDSNEKEQLVIHFR